MPMGDQKGKGKAHPSALIDAWHETKIANISIIQSINRSVGRSTSQSINTRFIITRKSTADIAATEEI